MLNYQHIKLIYNILFYSFRLFAIFFLVYISAINFSALYGQSAGNPLVLKTSLAGDTLNKRILREVDKIVEIKSDSITYLSKFEKLKSNLISDNYINANIDTAYTENDTFYVDFYIGNRLFFKPIIKDSSSIEILDFYEISLKDKYSLKQKELFENSVLTKLGNNGYPFAQLGFENITIENEELFQFEMKVKKNDFIVFDTFNMNPEVNINPQFLSNYLDIRPEYPYSTKKVLNIKKMIDGLPYLELTANPTVSFVNERAFINLPLKNIKANRFDFIIGLQPNTVNGIRKWAVTGDVTGEFQNLLGYGDYIFASFKRLKPENQDINLKFSMPYIFNLPIGPNVDFQLFKNGNINLDINSKIGFQYQLKGANYLSFYWQLFRSRLIDVDTTKILSNNSLPKNLDVDYNGGGVRFYFQDLDYRFNPSSGWELKTNISVGARNIIQNNTITNLSNDEIDFEALYDSLTTSNLQSNIDLDFSYFIKTGNIGTIKIGLTGAYKYSSNELLTNELIRVGGNRNLRGFDEESIFTGKYLMVTVENRFLLDKNSFLTLPFIQIANMKRRVDEIDVTDTPIGVGLGISFATPAGLFNVSFAAGKELDRGFDFNNTKIHFGYLSRF